MSRFSLGQLLFRSNTHTVDSHLAEQLGAAGGFVTLRYFFIPGQVSVVKSVFGNSTNSSVDKTRSWNVSFAPPSHNETQTQTPVTSK